MEAKEQLRLSISIIDGVNKTVKDIISNYNNGSFNYQFTMNKLNQVRKECKNNVDMIEEFGILSEAQAFSVREWIDDIVDAGIKEVRM